MAALREENVPRLLATMRPNVATAIRSYLNDDYTVVNAEGLAELGAYYEALFARFKILQIRPVNRIVESWYIFSELHWIVEHRGGERQGEVVEFCTADVAPIDAEGRFWVRTGAGTDPMPTSAGELDKVAPEGNERGPIERRGWEFTLANG
jgi:hypothetical protein